MRLLYVGGVTSAQKGAVGTHTRGVLAALAGLGIELHAIFLDDQVPDDAPGTIATVKASRRSGAAKKIADRLRLARAAARLAGGFDHVYARHDPFLSPLIASDKLILEYNDDLLTQVEFARRRGEYGRVGALIRGSAPYRALIKAIERYCFGRAAMVACVTRRLGELVLQRQPRSRILCMPNGSDASYRPELDPGHADNVLRIGHVGTLTHWDGLHELFHALADFVTLYPDKPVRLLLVGGEGPLKPELLTLARSLALDKVIEFHPSVDHRSALAALHAIDVVPLLKTVSAYDLSPIKYYEALCTGRFLLCSDIPHINELDPSQGIVVGFPLDIAEITAAIGALHDRRDEIRSGVRERSRLAGERHSWTARVRTLVDALEGQLPQPRGQSSADPQVTQRREATRRSA